MITIVEKLIIVLNFIYCKLLAIGRFFFKLYYCRRDKHIPPKYVFPQEIFMRYRSPCGNGRGYYVQTTKCELCQKELVRVEFFNFIRTEWKVYEEGL